MLPRTVGHHRPFGCTRTCLLFAGSLAGVQPVTSHGADMIVHDPMSDECWREASDALVIPNRATARESTGAYSAQAKIAYIPTDSTHAPGGA
eukprot:6213436-Pleurochrysis_carterae.AAC.2